MPLWHLWYWVWVHPLSQRPTFTCSVSCVQLLPHSQLVCNGSGMHGIDSYLFCTGWSNTPALQAIVMDKLLSGENKLDSMNSVYYMAPLSLLLLVPFVLLFELSDILTAWKYNSDIFSYFTLFVSGGIAFGLSMFATPIHSKSLWSHAVTHCPPTTDRYHLFPCGQIYISLDLQCGW